MSGFKVQAAFIAIATIGSSYAQSFCDEVRAGNGWCNSRDPNLEKWSSENKQIVDLNTANCMFDGGDCCIETCIERCEFPTAGSCFPCGFNGYNCRNPDVPSSNSLQVTVGYKRPFASNVDNLPSVPSDLIPFASESIGLTRHYSLFNLPENYANRCPSVLTSKNSATCNISLMDGLTITNPDPASNEVNASWSYSSSWPDSISSIPTLRASQFRFSFDAPNVREVHFTLLLNHTFFYAGDLSGDHLHIFANKGQPDQTYNNATWISNWNETVSVFARKASSIRELELRWRKDVEPFVAIHKIEFFTGDPHDAAWMSWTKPEYGEVNMQDTTTVTECEEVNTEDTTIVTEEVDDDDSRSAQESSASVLGHPAAVALLVVASFFA